MRSLVHDLTGLVHIIAAGAALLLGTLNLLKTKGTKTHKIAGYFYAISMILLNATAFGIYRLFNGWGPFHYAAVLSLATLIIGFLPALLRSRNWIQWHVAGMYYSVIGLYAALLSEVVTRIPGLPFGSMVGIGTAVVMVIGVFVFIRKRNGWIGPGHAGPTDSIDEPRER